MRGGVKLLDVSARALDCALGGESTDIGPLGSKQRLRGCTAPQPQQSIVAERRMNIQFLSISFKLTKKSTSTVLNSPLEF